MSVHILSTGGKDPHWGPQTSKMNFCEEDYHFSAYFGEFINTLTSLTYVYLGGCALRRQWRIGSKAEISHSLPYIALIIVGIGSAAYHATLKYPLQLVDDLSMLLAAGIMSHYVITINMGTGIQFGLFLLITLTLLLASWAHIQLGDSTLHQVVFGSMVVTVGFRTVKLVRDMIPDKELSWKLRRLARMGTFTLLSAYGLWLIDVFACSHLRKARHAVGLPWAWILELHGWWHNLTGIGVYIYMIVAEFVRDPHRTETLGENDGYYELLKGPGSLRRGEQKQNGVLKTD